jgi:hypothetical protein
MVRLTLSQKIGRTQYLPTTDQFNWWTKRLSVPCHTLIKLKSVLFCAEVFDDFAIEIRVEGFPDQRDVLFLLWITPRIFRSGAGGDAQTQLVSLGEVTHLRIRRSRESRFFDLTRDRMSVEGQNVSPARGKTPALPRV